jgi:hypothetical protein
MIPTPYARKWGRLPYRLPRQAEWRENIVGAGLFGMARNASKGGSPRLPAAFRQTQLTTIPVGTFVGLFELGGLAFFVPASMGIRAIWVCDHDEDSAKKAVQRTEL